MELNELVHHFADQVEVGTHKICDMCQPWEIMELVQNASFEIYSDLGRSLSVIPACISSF